MKSKLVILFLTAILFAHSGSSFADSNRDYLHFKELKLVKVGLNLKGDEITTLTLKDTDRKLNLVFDFKEDGSRAKLYKALTVGFWYDYQYNLLFIKNCSRQEVLYYDEQPQSDPANIETIYDEEGNIVRDPNYPDEDEVFDPNLGDYFIAGADENYN